MRTHTSTSHRAQHTAVIMTAVYAVKVHYIYSIMIIIAAAGK